MIRQNNLRLLAAAAILLATVLLQPTSSQPGCVFAVGDYRNCTCGVQYRIVEKRCCDDELCQQPMIRTENLTCPFRCMNGGTFDAARRQCFCTPGYYGLCCEIETKLCGAVFVQAAGNFTSLHFPQEYPTNVNCVWRISTDPVRRIALGTRDREFDLESGSTYQSCNYDYVSVRDGLNRRSRELGRFCGDANFPRTFHTTYSSSSHMYIEFKSDFIGRRKGFHLQYSTFFQGQECGPFARYTQRQGRITSPQYPLEYRPNERCSWTIEVPPPNTQVVLTVEEIDMPATPLCRRGDRLLVSGKRGSEVTLLTVFCGRQAFLPYSISGYSEIVLDFRSDRTMQGKGFVLEYRLE